MGERGQWKGRTGGIKGTWRDLVWIQIMPAVIVNKDLVVIQWFLLNEWMVSVLSLKNCPSPIIKQTAGVSLSSGVSARPGGIREQNKFSKHKMTFVVSGLSQGSGKVMKSGSSLVCVVETLLVAGASCFPKHWLPYWYTSVMESDRESLTGWYSIRREREAKKNPLVNWTN